MSKPSTPRDPVSIVIPVHNAVDRLEKVVPAWGDALARLGREYEIVVVDDGSTDSTPSVLEKLASGRVHHLRVLRHNSRRGFGACLKTALAEVQHPLFFYTSPDYPYTPSDIKPFLDRIEIKDEVLGKRADLISGCRTGRKAPVAIKWLGRGWRLFLRIAFGLQLQPLPVWLGMRENFYRFLVGFVFGVPMIDVNSAFKLYRTAFLRRVPIQSDGDFVHTELVAKATFLTSIMDEVPLSPTAAAEPGVPSVWREMWTVFTDPDFGLAATDPAEPGSPAPPAAAAPEPAPPAPPAEPRPASLLLVAIP
jgi:glycosyltransferase involved in cell wall biosynthesis